ncbi:YrzE family protein [Arthrobacter sp. C9C5]|uniref:YrzE family protein n=1 Tax=Arthrobacter sp. C9C5 TaxID=2735267 RepID=UPI00158598FD|nr:YrzE family protein [Arthrobacter sp. C9C5]NUU33252.1 YrzE family protein [Arthrobacter sp. C9C5]
MSSTAGPEDRLPRGAREEDAIVDRDARIHDARQDGVTAEQPVTADQQAERRAEARAENRAEARAERAEARAERANDTRAFPAAPLAGTAAAGTAGRDDRVIHGTRDDRLANDTVVEEVPTRETVVAREKEQFGGVKIGSAFFGWLAATGMAVLLTALVAAAGTAVGLATNTNVNEAVNQASQNQSVGIAGIIALLLILFVSYYCGGYVAGRMARFNGARQGLMVWIWALIAAIVVAILAMTAGQQFNVLANLNSFPRIPVNEGDLTATSMIAAVVIAAVALIGAMLGGLAGMRFHRKVDRAGFTPVETVEER